MHRHTNEKLWGSQQLGTFLCIVGPLLVHAELNSHDLAEQQDPVIESATMNWRERKTEEICGVKQSQKRCLNR